MVLENWSRVYLFIYLIYIPPVWYILPLWAANGLGRGKCNNIIQCRVGQRKSVDYHRSARNSNGSKYGVEKGVRLTEGFEKKIRLQA